MFVGHPAIAFALAALGARYLGWRPERALTVGLAAAAFALAPDVDVFYGPVGLARLAVADLAGGSGVIAALDAAFWTAGNEIHRGVTHSAVLAVPIALAAWAYARWLRSRVALSGRGRIAATRSAPAAGLLAGLLGAALVVGPLLDRGVLAGIAMLGALVAVALVVTTTATLTRLSPRSIGAAALVGLASHPFGDYFTGSTPALAYPLAAVGGEPHLVLHPDPTVHLVAAFLLELGTVWLALATVARLRGIALREHLHPRATVGVGYAAAVLALPAPTMEVSYQFVLSALAVGFVGATPTVTTGTGVGQWGLRVSRPSLADAVVTGLAAITLAVAAYGLVYAVV